MLAIPSVRYATETRFNAKSAKNISTWEPTKAESIHPGIFREYDIRGVIGKTLFPQDAYYIARAFASKAKDVQPPIICVGYDGRLSSPDLYEAVCQGVTDSGFDVIDVGVGPTPMLYYASYTSAAAGGIMITGSHNPPDHNGLKFVWQRGPFYGDDIRMLRTMAATGAFIGGSGTCETVDIRGDYIRALLNCYKGGPLNVAWDAGNGAAGDIMTVLCHKLPGRHMALNAIIDGTFPAHHPDPTAPETLRELISVVTRHGLDAGIAFDGDGDRLGVVDDEGEILWGDQLLMLYAAEILKNNPGGTVIADVKASDAFVEEITRLGGNPLIWKTGHSLIKSKMAEDGALLAGEMSGHLFFADQYFGYDDALYAALRLLNLLSRSGQKLSQLRKALPRRVNTPEIRFGCADHRKFTVIHEVKNRLREMGANVNEVDGVRVTDTDGWWLLRASNTQPMLVARCEARDAAGLQRLQTTLRAQLAFSGIVLPE
jgi:phosphomannomutase